MNKILIFVVCTLLLTSFIVASPMTSHATENEEKEQGNQLEVQTATENEGESTQIQAKVLTQAQVQTIKQERNRIMLGEGECPTECDCTGATMKCMLARGDRDMTVVAGNSGNVIMQVKRVDASTKVELYKSGGKVYGEFSGVTKEINAFPDQVRDKVRERLQVELEEEEIELDENGKYQYTAKENAKLFGFIKARIRVRAEVNAETGELVGVRNSWWSFLAKKEGTPILGASCGTVSPGSENVCCMNKGYDMWNSEVSTCVFSSE